MWGGMSGARGHLRHALPALGLLLAWLPACGGEGGEGGESSAGATTAAPVAPVSVAPVSVAKVQRRDVPLRLHAVGMVVSPASVVLKPQVEGRVVGVRFDEGDDVKAGDVLVVLDDRPARSAVQLAEASLARDQATAADAALEVEQMASVKDARAVSERAQQQAHASADAARAVVAADQAMLETARLKLDYCTLRAPFDGRTGLLGVRVGSVVKANETELLTISQVVPIRASFAVPQDRLPEIRAQQRQAPLAAVATPGGGAAVNGTLSFIDNAVDSSTGTIRLMATFANADRALWPGQYVDIALELSTDVGALVVPARAVQTGQQGDFVFVVRDDGTVTLRAVTVQRTAGADTLLAEGVTEGETVVTDGQLRLVDGAAVSFDT